MVPYKIEKGYDQTIKLIRLEDCGLNDSATFHLIESLTLNNQT